MKKLTVILVFLLAANAALAQLKKFTWEDWTCVYESTYDGRIYTERQLKNTYALWKAGGDYAMETFEATAFKLEDIANLRTAASLDAEYKEKAVALKNLEIVNVPYWKEYKAAKLAALERDYLLARASVKANENPSALGEVNFADRCVQRFAPPLTAGGDDLLKLWREVNEESRAKNASPENVRKEFESRTASADRFKYARMEILTFGWWNCVNAEIRRPDEKGRPEEHFKKLFKTTKKNYCDEP
ncbi:MAG TPA: hypothetical protein VIL74_02775 [Pyrinomonadaceae bacterium]